MLNRLVVKTHETFLSRKHSAYRKKHKNVSGRCFQSRVSLNITRDFLWVFRAQVYSSRTHIRVNVFALFERVPVENTRDLNEKKQSQTVKIT